MVKKAEKAARRARIACEKWQEYFRINIDEYHRIHDFVLGRQWTDDEEDMLKTYKKIPLQFNKLATLINTLLGEQQQNTPQLQVVPLDNCDQEVAKLRETIVKDIMFSTNAKTVYQIAATQSFVGGFGAFLWKTDYMYDTSFDLDILPQSFKDATRCYWDVGAERPNKTDGMHCGFMSRMSRAKFRSLYGKDTESKIVSEGSITASEEEIALAVQPGTGGTEFSWADDDSITILDHFERKHTNTTLYKLSNGRSLDQDELDELIESSIEHNAMMQEQQMMQMLQPEQQQMPQDGIEPQPQMGTDNTDIMTLWDDGEPVRIEDSRPIKKCKIMHYKYAGEYQLDKTEFPADQLPLVFVDQNSYYDKHGKQVCRSFIVDAIDAQRYLNYLGTQSAYILKVSRYDQFIGSKKNVSSNDTAQMWRDPASIQGMLTYDESPNGNKPEQLRPPELPQTLLTQYQRAIEDMYTSTGLYPSRLGQQGNEVSGAAIDARTRQGSYSTYVAFNAINRAISVGGEIVNEMIPRVYDSERVISLMTADEGQKNITINRQADEYGERIENDIRKGTYQVRLMAGPSYEGQKEQALESLNMVLQANPQLLNLFADLYAENLPLMNTIEIKNRLKTIVPPQIIEAGKTGKMPSEQENQQPNPEQQAMQMEQQKQQQEMQFKAKEIELKEQELEMKKQQIMLEAQFKLQELETERLETAGKLKEQELRYMAETQRTESDAAISHADNLVKILTHKIG